MEVIGESGFPRLEVPASEDPMQMSPDMDRHSLADEDIDIDLDLDTEQFDEERDDAMDDQNGIPIEDQQYDDEEVDDMVDDDGDIGKVTDHTSLVDEDLDDADNALIEGAFAEVPAMVQNQQPEISVSTAKTTTQHVTNPHRGQLRVPNQHNGEVPSYDTVQRPEEDQFDTPLAQSEHPVDDDDWLVDTEGPQASRDDVTAEKEQGLNEENTALDEDFLDDLDDTELGSGSFETPVAEGPFTTIDAPATEVPETGVSTQAYDEANHALEPQANEFPIPSRLHPITVNYQGSEMSLFPTLDETSDEAQTYLLKDQAVAAESMTNLLQQCRLILGDTVTERDELEIRIDELGLSINESEAKSLETTLRDIVELYVHLCYNDGFDSPETLYIRLVITATCSQRLDYLRTVVADDKGLSDLVFPYATGEANDGSVSYEEEGTDHENATNEDPSDAPEGEDSLHSAEENPTEATDIDSQLYAHVPDEPAPPTNGEAEESNDFENIRTETAAPNMADVSEANSIDNATKQRDTFEQETDYAEPPNTYEGGPDEGAAGDEDSIIDYSDEEDFHGETSTGSSTLQGDPVETSSSLNKTRQSQPVSLDADESEIIDYNEDDTLDVDTQDAFSGVDNHLIGEFAAQGQDVSHASDSGAAEPSGGPIFASEHRVSGEVGPTGLGGLQDEDIYDEDENQEPIQQLDDLGGHDADNPETETASYKAAFTPSRPDAQNPDDLINAIDGILEDPGSSVNTIRPDNEAVDTAAARTNGTASTVSKGQTDASAPAISESHLLEEEITFDEDDDDQFDSNPRPVSPRSLKRGRDSLEGESEMDQSTYDIKRARAS